MPRKLGVQYPGAMYRTLTLAWIAERLRLGASGQVACLLYHKHDEMPRTENKLF